MMAIIPAFLLFAKAAWSKLCPTREKAAAPSPAAADGGTTAETAAARPKRSKHDAAPPAPSTDFPGCVVGPAAGPMAHFAVEALCDRGLEGGDGVRSLLPSRCVVHTASRGRMSTVEWCFCPSCVALTCVGCLLHAGGCAGWEHFPFVRFLCSECVAVVALRCCRLPQYDCGTQSQWYIVVGVGGVQERCGDGHRVDGRL